MIRRQARASHADLDWPPIIARAAEIVRSYETSVTLRQLFYRLVAAQLVPNQHSYYKRLSALTATARRARTFPRLLDRGRRIHRRLHYAGVREGLTIFAKHIYGLDLTAGQDVSLYLGVEKAGIVEQLMAWFGRPLGLPVIALGGYTSQTYVDDIVDDVRAAGRPAWLLYAGDWDASGEDIDRDFIGRADCWTRVIRVALTVDQVELYQLPELPGNEDDARAQGFINRHGRLAQVELDALDPATLRSLFQDAIDQVWDTSLFEQAAAEEARDRERILRVARRWRA